MTFICFECGCVIPEEEVEFCEFCGEPLCPDCHPAHEESCAESQDDLI